MTSREDLIKRKLELVDQCSCSCSGLLRYILQEKLNRDDWDETLIEIEFYDIWDRLERNPGGIDKFATWELKTVCYQLYSCNCCPRHKAKKPEYSEI